VSRSAVRLHRFAVLQRNEPVTNRCAERLLMIVHHCLLFLSLVATVAAGSAAAQPDRVEFRDGDRVVLLGATFIERAQQFGHLEAALAARTNGSRVIFRNLGWSADTVFSDSRGIFDSPEKGYQRMLEHVRSLQPTLILICYGQNEALDASISIEQFSQQYEELVKELKPLGARLVLISPHELLPAPAPIPSPSRFNSDLQEYVAVVRDVAARTGVSYVDLFTQFTDDVWSSSQTLATGKVRLPGSPVEHADLLPTVAAHWTANGMHWNDEGYRVVSRVVSRRLTHVTDDQCAVEVELASRNVKVSGGRIRNAVWSDEAATLLRFELQPEMVTSVPWQLQITGQGRSAVEATVITTAGRRNAALLPQQDSDKSTLMTLGMDPQYEELRTALIRKNRLYFHRWRPQNITYLFGFRKHEQGQNAVEIPQFDPLVADMESHIEELLTPVWVTVELSARDK